MTEGWPTEYTKHTEEFLQEGTERTEGGRLMTEDGSRRDLNRRKQRERRAEDR